MPPALPVCICSTATICIVLSSPTRVYITCEVTLLTADPHVRCGPALTGNCTGHCQGGTGVRTETWYVNVSTSCGGTCPFANNTHRNTLTCVNNDTCPPQNCVGSWVANGACNGTCGGGAGILPEIYKVTVPAMYNGTECPVTNWTTRADTPCNNTYPCPINCVGNWVTITGNCTGACQGGQGFVPERYNVTVPAQYGGVDCNYTNGAYRYVIPCTNNNPCPPQDCQGIWVQNGSCMGGCGGQRSRGLLPERYKITVPAAYGGNSCPIAEGDTRMITACTNNNPCVNIPCNATCECGRERGCVMTVVARRHCF